MEGMYIGIKLNNNEMYRVDCRRSLVQKGCIDVSGYALFNDVGSSFIRQTVESLKGVSQLSFKDYETGIVFEIEMHQRTRNVTIIMTDSATGASRLLNSFEFRMVIDDSWFNLFDEKGNLVASTIFDVNCIDLSRLCNLSKDILTIGLLHYIKNGGTSNDIRVNMAQIIPIVISHDDYIATVQMTENTPVLIEQWYDNGCPLE